MKRSFFCTVLLYKNVIGGFKFEYSLSPTLSTTTAAPHHHFSSLDIVDQITSKADRNYHGRCSASPKTTAPTVQPTKEKATIKMDNFIDYCEPVDDDEDD